jgi:hypothetical protein
MPRRSGTLVAQVHGVNITLLLSKAHDVDGLLVAHGLVCGREGDIMGVEARLLLSPTPCLALLQSDAPACPLRL